MGHLSPQADAFLAEYFSREILPALTPIALDQAHPFPSPREESFQLAIRFRPTPGRRSRYGVVLVHPTLPRFIRVQDGATEKVLSMEHVVARYLHELFPQAIIEECWVARVTRLELGSDDTDQDDADGYELEQAADPQASDLQHAA
jgi:polyphosphate kinase